MPRAWPFQKTMPWAWPGAAPQYWPPPSGQVMVVPAPLRMHLQVDAKEAIRVVIKELC
jgi:hypothetical protein